MSKKQKLCLVMIVKNEAHVIARAIRSALPIIDTYCIVDTGSTDDTLNILRKELAGLPGELHERPWKNFAHNKSEMIELSAGLGAYNLLLDADDIMTVPEGYKLPTLTEDVYNLMVIHGPTRHFRPHIFRNSAGFFYTSVVHEYLHREKPFTEATLSGLVYTVVGGGARSGNSVAKFKRDVSTLEEALAAEPENARYVFYLAQSYRDLGTETAALCDKDDETSETFLDALSFFAKAIKHYKRRATMGSFYQEVFVSLLEVAGLLWKVMPDREAFITKAYLEAFESLPERGPEALYYLARYLRLRNKYALAYLYAKGGAGPLPKGALFVDPTIYAWGLLDEKCIAAYYIGRHEEAIDGNSYLLTLDIPEPDRERIKENLRLSKEKLAGR